MNPKRILRGLAVIATLAVLGYLFQATPFAEFLNERWIDREVRGQGLSGDFLFLGIGAVATAIGFPRQIVAFLGGYAYGAVTGTLLATLAAALGCALAFFYARLLGRELVARRFPARIRKLDAFVHDHPFSMTLLIRLLPVGSNLVTNLVAGVTRVRAMPFLAGSVIGYLPQSAVFALVGSGIQIDPLTRIGGAVVLFVVSGLIGVHLYRRHRHGRSFDEALDRELGESANSEENSDSGATSWSPAREWPRSCGWRGRHR